ncbi:MAG TPA: energy transducer TonB [Candidatus Eremiobacteraceae bacterium]|nr:energy transducer TonB [Candidatus Eremiobacteraceae bacterium]
MNRFPGLRISPVAWSALTAVGLLFCTGRGEAATCPITLESVVDVGRAASGAYESYQVTVTGGAGQVSSISFLLRTSGSSTTDETTWQDVTLAQDKRVAYKWQVPRALGTFDRPTADISAVSISRVVTSPTSAGIDCSLAWQSVTDVQSEFGIASTEIDTFDSAHVIDPSVQSFAKHVYETPGNVDLGYGYPRQEMLKGIQGVVNIEIFFNASGLPNDFRILDSSQDDGLDTYALAEARRIRYAPPLKDGKPDPDGAELVVYAFPKWPAPAPEAPRDSCPAQISFGWLSNAGQSGETDWYTVVATTSAANITSLEVAAEDASGTRYSIPWNQVAFANPPGASGNDLDARGAFAWSAAALTKVWVDKITYADGHQTTCDKFYAVVDQSAAAKHAYRVWAGAPEQASVFNVKPAIFGQQIAQPVFPPAALSAHSTGRVFVDTIIDPKGKPVASLVVGSSGYDDLDRAAVEAAMKSRYEASPGTGLRVVLTSYGFLSEPGGDAFFRNHI